MIKTFGQLRAGDEVYVIKGNSVEIVKVSVAATRSNSADTLLRMSGCVFHVPAVHVKFYHEAIGDIYCDIDEAIKTMKEKCEKALHDYREASGALNKLEAKKKLKIKKINGPLKITPISEEHR